MHYPGYVKKEKNEMLFITRPWLLLPIASWQLGQKFNLSKTSPCASFANPSFSPVESHLQLLLSLILFYSAYSSGVLSTDLD